MSLTFSSKGYELTDDPDRVDFDVVASLLNPTYWAATRSREQIIESCRNSACFSLFFESAQVGMFRALSDRGAYTYLMDFVVAPEHQRKGIGSWALQCILGYPPFRGTRFILLTMDAQEFYRKFGFDTHPYECMIRRED